MIEILNNNIGCMWTAVLIIISIRLIDKIIGKPLEGLFSFGGALHVEYYPSLWAKYHDKNYYRYKAERAFAYTQYKNYIRRAVSEQNLTTWYLMRQAKRKYDYITLYNLEKDIDGIIDYIKY